MKVVRIKVGVNSLSGPSIELTAEIEAGENIDERISELQLTAQAAAAKHRQMISDAELLRKRLAEEEAQRAAKEELAKNQAFYDAIANSALRNKPIPMPLPAGTRLIPDPLNKPIRLPQEYAKRPSPLDHVLKALRIKHED